MTRCKECNKVYQRGILYKNQLTEGSLEAWDKMPKDRKMAFIKENHELMGENLKAKLQAVCTDEVQRSLTISLQGNGAFLDSPDLAESTRINLIS